VTLRLELRRCTPYGHRAQYCATRLQSSSRSAGFTRQSAAPSCSAREIIDSPPAETHTTGTPGAKPVHDRHHQIEQDQAGPAALEHLQPCQAIMGGENVVAGTSEGGSFDLSDVGIIFDDENGCHRNTKRRPSGAVQRLIRSNPLRRLHCGTDRSQGSLLIGSCLWRSSELSDAPSRAHAPPHDVQRGDDKGDCDQTESGCSVHALFYRRILLRALRRLAFTGRAARPGAQSRGRRLANAGARTIEPSPGRERRQSTANGLPGD
jgi:hypothetical protein